jgi:hypothetical protein
MMRDKDEVEHYAMRILWRIEGTGLDFGTRWRYVVSFTLKEKVPL